MTEYRISISQLVRNPFTVDRSSLYAWTVFMVDRSAKPAGLVDVNSASMDVSISVAAYGITTSEYLAKEEGERHLGELRSKAQK